MFNFVRIICSDGKSLVDRFDTKSLHFKTNRRKRQAQASVVKLIMVSMRRGMLLNFTRLTTSKS